MSDSFEPEQWKTIKQADAVIIVKKGQKTGKTLTTVAVLGEYAGAKVHRTLMFFADPLDAPPKEDYTDTSQPTKEWISRIEVLKYNTGLGEHCHLRDDKFNFQLSPLELEEVQRRLLQTLDGKDGRLKEGNPYLYRALQELGLNITA